MDAEVSAPSPRRKLPVLGALRRPFRPDSCPSLTSVVRTIELLDDNTDARRVFEAFVSSTPRRSLLPLDSPPAPGAG